jgi:hypothetical protein
MRPEALSLAVSHSKEDGVGPGFCGRGVYSVLKRLGYGGIRSADGGDWEQVLSDAGWRPLYCPSPEWAPFGSVLVYLSDLRVRGYNKVGTKGGLYGHVELVACTGSGQRRYVSDAARVKPGGTVPVNFTKRAWIPPSSGPLFGYSWGYAWYDVGLLKRSVGHLQDKRLAMAEEVFRHLGFE